MEKRFITGLLFTVFWAGVASAQAQSIPFLNELLARNAEFNKLFNEKRRAGKISAKLEPLRQRGEQAFRAGRVDELLAIVSEGLAVLKGTDWDERQKFFASLTLEINRLVLEPQTELQVALARMFPSNLEKAFSKTPTVTLELRAADSKSSFKPLILGSQLAIAEASTMANRRIFIPDGEYLVVASIEAEGKKVGEVQEPVYAIAEFTDRLNKAQSVLGEIKSSTEPQVKAVADLLPTPAFWIQRLLPLTQSVGEESPNPIVELRRIETSLAALKKGENPFASERGEAERAYLSPDNQLVPYRVYVPKSYDAQAARPLVVLLHDALGDEKTYFSPLYDEVLIKGEAERRGWIFVAPNGRGRFGGFARDLALEDIARTIELTRRDYKIDEARIYLTGHSMGGGGAWLMAAKKPDLFAAFSPVAGGGQKEGEEVKRILAAVKSLPVLIVHGAKDGIVPPQGSRDLYAAAQKAGLNATYLEMPNDDHVTVVGASFIEVLNFFEKQVKPNGRQ